MHPVDKGTCREVTQPLLLINYEQFQWKTNVQQMSMLEQDKAERKMITLKCVLTQRSYFKVNNVRKTGIVLYMV